jgi:hypothetical protein
VQVAAGRIVLADEDATASLLWAACRPIPDLDACEAARQAGADLARAADLAITQRVSGLLWRVVRPRMAGPSPWADLLQRDAMRCRGQALLLLPRIAGELLQPLAAAGLEPLVFKGAALAGRYPAPGLRPMDDVDLILPEEQHRAAVDVLSRTGWQVRTRPGQHYDTLLVHPHLPGLPVELHREVATAAERSCRLTAIDMWRARQPITLAGAPAFGLNPELELIALATHAAKPYHTFERLMWSVDVAVVIAAAASSGRSVDWAATEALADRARARSALAVALTHATRLGVDSPSHLREVAATGARRVALRPLLDHDWPVHSTDAPTRFRLGFALIDDPALRVRRGIRQVFAEGLSGAPRQAADLGWRAGRRWWRLRRGRRQPVSSSRTRTS